MPRLDATGRSALANAGEVAQWAVMLLGWLYLGEQGMRLGWSLASGVTAVALWWAVRIVCRGSAWAFQCSPAVLGLCGLLTAAGVWLPGLLNHPHAAQAALLAVAVTWGLWGALVETRTHVSTIQLGPVAWHPLLAAGLAGVVWRVPGGESFAPLGVSLLLAACAAVLHARDRGDRQRASCAPGCRGPLPSLAALLAPSSMGLMMGTLWLGNVWCAGLGLSTSQMVMAHLALMAGLPAVVALLLPCLRAQSVSSHKLSCVSSVLLALGALMLPGNGAVFGALAMLLPSLAWALHCSRQRSPVGLSGVGPPWASRTLALLLGPSLLLWAGLISPSQGPWAAQSALALLGGMAALQAGILWWRPRAPEAVPRPI